MLYLSHCWTFYISPLTSLVIFCCNTNNQKAKLVTNSISTTWVIKMMARRKDLVILYFNSQRITTCRRNTGWWEANVEKQKIAGHLYRAKDPTNSAGWSLSISGAGSWQLKNSRSFSQTWSYSNSAPTIAMNMEPTMIATPTYQMLYQLFLFI